MRNNRIDHLAVRWGIPLLLLAIFAAAVFFLNRGEKTELVNRTGQTFETGVVTRILQDNVQEDGTRVGQQTVVVRMTSGEREGEELTTTSSAGYLFGAACTVEMKVVVLQSLAGATAVTSVYSSMSGKKPIPAAHRRG